MGVEELDFTHASEADLHGMYEVLVAWALEDRPGGQKPPRAASGP